MNRVNYGNPKAVKSVLYYYDDLMVMARKGDQDSIIVCMDIKWAIHTRGVLTFKQRRYLSLWWQGFDYVEIATMYRKNPTVIKRRVDLACRKISDFLCRKGSFDPLSVPNYRRVKNG